MAEPDHEVIQTNNIEIKSGDTRAIINPIGASVERLQIEGHEVIFPPTSFQVGDKQKERGAIPILFPIAGPPPEDHPTLKLDQHGFARNLHWVVLNRENESTTLQLTSTKETKVMYPYDFVFKNIISVKNGVLRYEWQITNKGNDPMPSAPGIHPYFRITKTQASTLETNIENLPSTEDWPKSYISDLPESGIIAKAPDWGEVKVSGSEHFRKAVVWSDWLDNYACFELFRGDSQAILDENAALITLPRKTENMWVEIEFDPASS